MIILYSGTPGSGKSCHQAEDVMDFLKNRNVACLTNYHIKKEMLKFGKYSQWIEITNEWLKPNNLKAFSAQWFAKHHFREGNIRLYIDEAQLIFSNREWQQAGRKEWLEFFTQHRKYGYDIYLISQWDRMLDKQIRALIEYEYKHRRLKNADWKGKLLGFALGGDTYLSIKYWYPMQSRLGSEIHHIRKKYYAIYDSYKDFRVDDLEEVEINVKEGELGIEESSGKIDARSINQADQGTAKKQVCEEAGERTEEISVDEIFQKVTG